MRRIIRYKAIPFCAIVISIMGCSGSSDGPDLVKVQGTVTLNGSPLPEAAITFHPQDDSGRSASAVTDEKGNYNLLTLGSAGAVAGSYKVTVKKYSAGDPEFSSGDPSVTGLDEMQLEAQAPLDSKKNDSSAGQKIPPEYSDEALTTLTAKIPDGGTKNLDIAITTK